MIGLHLKEPPGPARFPNLWSELLESSVAGDGEVDQGNAFWRQSGQGREPVFEGLDEGRINGSHAVYGNQGSVEEQSQVLMHWGMEMTVYML